MSTCKEVGYNRVVYRKVGGQIDEGPHCERPHGKVKVSVKPLFISCIRQKEMVSNTSSSS